MFAHNQRIHGIQVIAGNGFEYGVTMVFVEGERGGIIHCSFEKHSGAVFVQQARLRAQ